MKEKLKNAIAIVMAILMIYMEINGFWFAYLFLWFIFDLPIDWWAMFVTCVLACASVWGVKEWLVRN